MWTNSDEELAEDRMIEITGGIGRVIVFVAKFTSREMVDYDNCDRRGHNYWLWRTYLILPSGLSLEHYDHTQFNCRSAALTDATQKLGLFA